MVMMIMNYYLPCPTTPPIGDKPCRFIRDSKINSYRKLSLLLHLYRNSNCTGTCEALARQLHWGNSFFVEDIVAELEAANIVIHENNHYRLVKRPQVQQCVRCLLARFECPLKRQKLLAQVEKKSLSISRRRDLLR